MPDDQHTIEVLPVEHYMEEAAGPKISAFASGARVAPIVPRTVGEVAMVAAAVIKGGLAPDSYQDKDGATPEERAERTKSRIMLGIMKGAEVGFPPITALSTIAIIGNRPCIWGDGAVALTMNSGLIVRIETLFEGGSEKDSGPTLQDDGATMDHAPRITDFPDQYTAVCRIWRSGHEQPFEGRFSVRDARRARLWGNSKRVPWIEHPKRMLMARARAFALRDGFADALFGLSIREEIEDLPPPPAAKTNVDFLADAPAATTQAALPAPTEQLVHVGSPIPDQKTAAAEPVEARVGIGGGTAAQDTKTVRSAPAPQPTTSNPSCSSDRPGGNTPVGAPEPLRGVTPAEWWAEAARSGNYTVKVAAPLASTGRDQLCALIGEAPDQKALLQFQADNSRQISSIDLASKAAAKAVRQKIADRLDEFDGGSNG